MSNDREELVPAKPLLDFTGFEEEVDEDRLNQLRNFCALMTRLEADVAAKEAVLGEAQSKLSEVKNKIIPELMRELTITGLDLDDGSRIEVKKNLCGTFFSKEQWKRAEGFKWLEEQGLDKIIKNEVSVRLDKEQNDQAEALVEIIKSQMPGVQVEREQNINHNTLQATLRERMRDYREHGGEEPPLQKFGMFEMDFAIMKAAPDASRGKRLNKNKKG